MLPHHDAFLVACYSQHPLVSQLKRECKKLTREATIGNEGRGVRKHVTGIFEASVLACLGLVDGVDGAFGIVSTGAIWEDALKSAVEEFLRSSASETSRSRFAGCETTGLNASELHELDADDVRGKMMDATKRLLQREQLDDPTKEIVSSVQAICLGCAGMVGLDEAVRTACIETLGGERGKEVHIVDGVKAGVGILYGLARGGF